MVMVIVVLPTFGAFSLIGVLPNESTHLIESMGNDSLIKLIEI
jgi:hypothetical protein